jgi:putative hydrolase of the HAD superfamily
MRAMRIVFDFAGVLFHWNPLRLVQRELPQHAPDAASSATVVQQIFEGYGGDWGDFDRGVLDVPELVERICARSGLPHRGVRSVVEAVPMELQPMPGTVSLLRRLHAQGRRLHYLSNMPASYAEHLERAHDFIGCFDSGVFSSRVHAIKPEPQIYALAAQRFGAQPAQLVFIDDVLDNVLAARQAGWQAVHFVDAADCEAQLRANDWI